MMPGKQGSLAERLRVLRARKGLTLVEASKAIGIDRHTLRDLERGKRAAYFPTIEKIAKGYGVAVSTLVAESEEDSEAAGVKQEPVLSGKVEAPPVIPPSSSAASKTSEAGQRTVDPHALEAFSALSSYVQQRASMYEEDLSDPNGQLFTNPAAAAVWASTVIQEAFMLAELVGAQAEPLIRSISEEGRRTAKNHVERIAQHLVELARVSEQAQERFAYDQGGLDMAAQEPFGMKIVLGPIDFTQAQHYDVPEPGVFTQAQQFDLTQPEQRAAASRHAIQVLQATAKEIQKQVA